VILSDRTLREQIEAGRIGIEPLGPYAIQPSSIDVRIDNVFRIFRNHDRRVIDVKEDLSDLTEVVEVDEGEAFILHPGEFVLASTLEVVSLPDDLVARIEGKSSLARLGLLIHSSLPASEVVFTLRDGVMSPTPIGDVVQKELEAYVVSFDPETFRVGYEPITGYYEGPADRIYRIRLASGRSVEVTAGHNLFTVDREGELKKVRTGDLRPGARVAVPKSIPAPPDAITEIALADHIPDRPLERFVVEGPTIRTAIEHDRVGIQRALADDGIASAAYWFDRGRLPLAVARQFVELASLTDDDRVGCFQGTNPLPARFEVGEELAWTLGMFVAEGYRRRQQVVISNTVQERLDRIASAMDQLGLGYHRSDGAITVGSIVLSSLLGWLGTGGKAPTKRVPPIVFGWPDHLVAAFVEGLVDGDGSFDGGRTSVWTTSEGLVGDLLVLFARLGRRAGSAARPQRGNQVPSWQVYAPDGEHKLLTAIPLPDQLIIAARSALDVSQKALAEAADFSPSNLNNVERRVGRDAIRRQTLQRIRDGLESLGGSEPRLDRLVDGDLAWDSVVEVVDTGRTETIYDIEVRPDGRKIENFLAGNGGIFVSNTAGFIDPGFSGHITLELANVATLPITLYPGMKIGQISFQQMTTPADVPYGSSAIGSKYQGQRGPTPSRYFENFRN